MKTIVNYQFNNMAGDNFSTQFVIFMIKAMPNSKKFTGTKLYLALAVSKSLSLFFQVLRLLQITQR